MTEYVDIDFLKNYKGLKYIKIELLDGTHLNISFDEAYSNNLPCFYLIYTKYSNTYRCIFGKSINDNYQFLDIGHGELIKHYYSLKESLNLTDEEIIIINKFKLMELI